MELTKDVIKKDLPKFFKAGKNLDALENILYKKLPNNPYLMSSAKSGDLSDYRAMNWSNGYRVLYKILEEEKIVIVAAIDSHDESYKKLKKRI